MNLAYFTIDSNDSFWRGLYVDVIPLQSTVLCFNNFYAIVFKCNFFDLIYFT